jgi:Protein of unknown function (DUF1569)
MHSLWQNEDRESLLRRIASIDDSSRGQWGKMTVDRMLSHLVESMRMAVGELQCASKKLPIRYFPLKQLILYVLPFPKGAPTAPELLKGAEAPVSASRDELQSLVSRFAAKPAETQWPEHPAFGKLSRSQWGILTYRHLDHHLRQFGA